MVIYGVVYGKVAAGGLKLSAHYDFIIKIVFFLLYPCFEIAFSFSLYVLVCFAYEKAFLKAKLLSNIFRNYSRTLKLQYNSIYSPSSNVKLTYRAKKIFIFNNFNANHHKKATSLTHFSPVSHFYTS